MKQKEPALMYYLHNYILQLLFDINVINLFNMGCCNFILTRFPLTLIVNDGTVTVECFKALTACRHDRRSMYDLKTGGLLFYLAACAWADVPLHG